MTLIIMIKILRIFISVFLIEITYNLAWMYPKTILHICRVSKNNDTFSHRLGRFTGGRCRCCCGGWGCRLTEASSTSKSTHTLLWKICILKHTYMYGDMYAFSYRLDVLWVGLSIDRSHHHLQIHTCLIQMTMMILIKTVFGGKNRKIIKLITF